MKLRLYVAWWSVAGIAHSQTICNSQSEAEQFILKGLVDCLGIDLEILGDVEVWDAIAEYAEFQTINYDWDSQELEVEVKLG